ncbi:MAG: UDP-N-acetylmuramate:L-alanyl-gamma-D-glutamyl-meso-diaminopimelate ligase [Oligoflexia bacterium]|nr:UDP-N-acetylmuramate:L-alanyl-gamma-D-glutamyl-meso-diaminopimelate ligase [Oligoflexia bacterium]
MKKNELIHMMGICGTAMGALAGLLKEMGYRVRGSDQNVYPPMSLKLKELGIDIIQGYKPENLTPRPDRVIVGNVMSKTHSEVQELLKSDIPYMSLPEAMGEYLIGNRHSVVISGTHGKTTTTAMAAWILSSAGLDPGFMIGGLPLNFANSFNIGRGNYFVIEGDEYDTAFFDKVPKFIHYKPRSVILTSIEFDHADIYKDLNAVKDAFIMLLKLIPNDGLFVYNGEDENIKSILNHLKCKNVHSYGGKHSDWRIDGVKFSPEFSEFDIVHNEKKVNHIKSELFGEYNLLNALSVYIVAKNLNISEDKIINAFKAFKGVKRRQEIIGKPHGVTVIDDFAHHPTAVELTIDGVKKRFTKGNVFAVFEPRSATARRKIFQTDFAKALSHGDVIILSEPYDQAKIAPEDRFDAKAVIEKCKAYAPQKECLIGKDADEIIKLITKRWKPGDVVLFMSNGGFGGIYEKILKT